MANLLQIQTDYLNRIFDSIHGMKSLILDDYSVIQLGLIYTQSLLISKQVYHTAKLSSTAANIQLHSTHTNGHNNTNGHTIQQQHNNINESMQHMKCIIICRPTNNNIQHIITLINSQQHTEYHIYFTHISNNNNLLEQLANNDKYECIVQIHEYYLDYYILNDYTYHFDCYGSTQLSYKDTSLWIQYERQLYDIHIQSLLCIFLSLKKKPDIRFSNNSDICRMLAYDIERTMDNSEYELFTFNEYNKPLCIILDRHNDSITPLLHQWTYKAMIHDLINIKHNTVTLHEHKDSELTSSHQQHDVILNSNNNEIDTFYANSQYLNFGDLGVAIKKMVSEYSIKKNQSSQLDTIEQLTKVVESLPELKQATNNVNKHVSIMYELNDIVNKQSLMKLSECEQDIVCSDDIQVYDRMCNILQDHSIHFNNKLRLAALYVIKYENNNDLAKTNKIKSLLRSSAATPHDVRLCNFIDELIKYSGQNIRNDSISLFNNSNTKQSFFTKATNILYNGVSGVENIYTRHKPYIADLINTLQQNKLSTNDYPYANQPANNVDNISPSKQQTTTQQQSQYKLIILFIVGGITYAEQTCIQQFNQQNTNNNIRIVLGGSCIHNAQTFINDVMNVYSNEHSKQLRDIPRVIQMKDLR